MAKEAPADPKAAQPVPDVAGIYDGLGPTEQAAKDAATVPDGGKPADKEPETPGGETPPGDEQTPEDEKPPDESKGEVGGEGEGTTPEPIEVSGREFKTVDDLKTAYIESSDEGLRLHGLVEDLKAQLAAEVEARMKQEDEAEKSPFPGLLSDEELDKLSPARMQEYLFKRDKWERQKDEAKSARDEARAQVKRHQEEIGAAMRETERRMGADSNYPDFRETRELREKVLKMTPFLANREETPVVSYYVALGILAANDLREGKGKTDASRKAAAQVAAASGAQSPRGGQTASRNKKLTVDEEEADRTVAAYRARSIY